MSKECNRFVNRVVDLIARKKEREILRRGKAYKALIALRGYRGKKIDNTFETNLSEVSYNLIPAAMNE